jgi:heme A synthase
VSVTPLYAAAGVLAGRLSTVPFGGVLVVWIDQNHRTGLRTWKHYANLVGDDKTLLGHNNSRTSFDLSSASMHSIKVAVCTTVLIRLHVRKPQRIDQM